MNLSPKPGLERDYLGLFRNVTHPSFYTDEYSLVCRLSGRLFLTWRLDLLQTMKATPNVKTSLNLKTSFTFQITTAAGTLAFVVQMSHKRRLPSYLEPGRAEVCV